MGVVAGAGSHGFEDMPDAVPPAAELGVDIADGIAIDRALPGAAVVLRADHAGIGNAAIQGDIIESVIIDGGDLRGAVDHGGGDVRFAVDGDAGIVMGIAEGVAGDIGGQRAKWRHTVASAGSDRLPDDVLEQTSIDHVQAHIARTGGFHNHHGSIRKRVAEGGVIDLENCQVGGGIAGKDAMCAGAVYAGEQAA